MDVDGKRNSPLPSNYVTLVQLQERWLKEQQRKQAESEEEEKRKQREKEEQERKREELENQMKRHHENVERSNKTNTVPRQRFNVNRGNQSEKSSRTTGVSEKKAEELLIGPIVAHDEERKIDESTKNKSKKKRKPSKEEDQTRAEKKIPVVVNEGKGEKEVNTSEIKRNANNLLMNVMDGEKKVPVDRSVEIGRKLKDLSLSGGKGGHGRSSGKCDKVSGKFHFQKLQKPRDSNLVWVRKGESSGVGVALRSGVVVKAGESQKKPVRMGPKETGWREWPKESRWREGPKERGRREFMFVDNQRDGKGIPGLDMALRPNGCLKNLFDGN
ncbi:hypothetical protein HYC85_020444 [Camellia sinensis]|uniref:Uncharacterized protein n=1 Tax=Camellia sinensis TaxID=4442 RepID=A0A7J7GPT1_CAMSI|nr:hypothetical protein HYC85_020444 [Camellia sinensis]